jgi:hypothetical protein
MVALAGGAATAPWVSCVTSSAPTGAVRTNARTGVIYHAPRPSGGDDAPALNTFFDEVVKDGVAAHPNTVLFRAGAVYRINSAISRGTAKAGLWSYGRRWLIYHGQGCTFDSSERTMSGMTWRVQESSNCTFKDFTTTGLPVGSPASNGFSHGLGVQGGSDLLLDGVTSRDVSGGDGFYFGDSPSGVAMRMTLQNFTVSRCSRQGVSLVATDTVTIRDGVIDDVENFNLLDLEPLGGKFNRGVMIDGVRFGRYGTNALLSSVNMSGGENSDVTIQNCASIPGTDRQFRIHAKAPAGTVNTGLKILRNRAMAPPNADRFLFLEAGSGGAIRNVKVGRNTVRFVGTENTAGVRIALPRGCQEIEIHDNEFQLADEIYTVDDANCVPTSTNNLL